MKTYLLAAFVFVSSSTFAQNAELKITNEAAENNTISPDGFKLNRLNKESSFYKAGARDGDYLLQVDGRKIETIAGFAQVYEVLSSPSKPTHVVIKKNGIEKTLTVSPKAK